MVKNILALISEGGGGHKSAGESLVQILANDYDVDVVNGVGTILAPFDWFKRLTRGKISGEAVYNWFLQTERGFWLRAYIFKGKKHLYRRKEKIAQYFDRYLQTQEIKYDLIISTIPYVNHGLILAAKKHNIPFLLLPTDLDVTGFLSGFNDLAKNELPPFKIALAYDRSEIVVNVFKSSHLQQEDVVFSGFPVRPACQIQYTQEMLDQLKTKLGMESHKKTITLVMGAAGCKGIVEHAKTLSQFDASLQVNVCMGRNEKSKKTLIDWIVRQGGCIVDRGEHCVKLETKSGALFLIRGYTKEIIALLACADLVISKTGSCTVNEAIYLKKKLLLDNSAQSTAHFLPWEEFNVWFVKQHNLGTSFTKSEDLLSLVPSLLTEGNNSPCDLTLPDFQTNIKTLVGNLTSGTHSSHQATREA